MDVGNRQPAKGICNVDARLSPCEDDKGTPGFSRSPGQGQAKQRPVPPHAQATRFGGKQQFLEIDWQRKRGFYELDFDLDVYHTHA
jgi:hypothetical protein